MALTKVQYLRLATGLPIVLPIPFVIILVLLDPAGVHLPDWMTNPLALAFDALFLFGPVWIVLAAIILLLLRKHSWRAHAAAAALAPWLMIVCAGLTYSFGDRSTTLWTDMKIWAVDCLTVGYSYVALTFGGLLILPWTEGVKG